MKKVLLVLLAVMTLTSLSAQKKGNHHGTNQLRVIWIEIENQNTSAQILGPAGGSTYGDATCGDWTLGGTVPYPMADDAAALSTCSGLYENTVPTVFFIAPNGYYRSIYGEEDGIYSWDTAQNNANLLQIMNSYPRAGQLPIVDIYGYTTGILGSTSSYSANILSVDDVVSTIWSVTGGTITDSTANPIQVAWNTVGPQTVTCTVTNTTGSTTETLNVEVIDCSVDGLPYSNGFDAVADFSCWDIIDADGDGISWYPSSELFQSAGHNNSAGAAASASYINGYGALTPDNWMISPAITLPAEEQTTLEWWSGAADSNYFADHYSVLLSTTGTALTDFTETLYEGNNEAGAYTQHSVSLAAYAGQTVHIAFRHYNCTDIYWLLIDDVVVRLDNTNDSVAAPAPVAHVAKGRSKAAQWAHIDTPFTTYDFRDTQHQYPISLQAWLDSGYCVVVDYSCTWCNPCWNLHQAGILEGYFDRFGPTFSYPYESIEEVNNIDVKIYPNPATDMVIVEAEGLRQVELFDLEGRSVLTSERPTVSLQGLATGAYMLRVSTEKGTAVQRIVKK